MDYQEYYLDISYIQGKKTRLKPITKEIDNGSISWAEWHHLVTMPADPLSFTIFLLHKVQLGHSFTSCKSVFYRVKYVHKLYRCRDPTTGALPTNMLEAHMVNKNEPIGPSTFRKLHRELVVVSRKLLDVRTMAFVVFGFRAFLRYNEIIRIRKGNVVLHQNYMKVFIEKSKTDVYRGGKWMYISTGISSTCPVEIIRLYLRKGGFESQKKEAYLFRAVTKTKHKEYLREKNRHITYSTMRHHLLQSLTRVGEEAKEFGTHSLRSGGATAAANAGVPDRLFKRHGRWKTDRAKNGYIKENLKDLLLVSQSLGL